jgi:hypothetical protein
VRLVCRHLERHTKDLERHVKEMERHVKDWERYVKDPRRAARMPSGRPPDLVPVSRQADPGLGHPQPVRVWDTHSGAELSCLCGHEDSWSAVTSVAFSPDGRLLASGSDDKTVRLWDVHRGAELRCLRAHESGVNGVAFSPDGRLLASASYDETVRLWDVHRGAELHRLHGPVTAVQSVAFSPDGRLLAGASYDKTVRLWDVSKNKLFLRLQGPTRSVDQVCFSAQGRRLVSWSDWQVWVWDTCSGIGAAVRLNIWLCCFFGAVGLVPGGCLVAVLGLVLAALAITSWIVSLVGLTLFAGGCLLVLCLALLRRSKWRTLLLFRIPARPPPAPAWQLQARGGETVILADPAAAPIACFPEPLEGKESAAHPSGRTWAGGVGNYVCLFTLEGNPPGSAPRTN